MGNTSSKNTKPPNYNQVFKSNEIKSNEIELNKEHDYSIYHEICNHYNLGNKFDKLKKYFINLTFDDIYSSSFINYVELVEPIDKIMIKVFDDKYLSKYKYYKRNLNQINLIKKLKDYCNQPVLVPLQNKLNESLQNYYDEKKEFIQTKEILKEFNKEGVKDSLKSIFDLNDIEKTLNW